MCKNRNETIKKTLASTEIFLVVVLIAIFIAFDLSLTNPLTTTPATDSGFFMYTGDQILKGKLLYVDIWDNKGPLIFYINALGLYLAKGFRWGVWAVEFLFLFSSALIGYQTLSKRWGRASALFGTFVWVLGLHHLHGGRNSTEEYSLLFSFITLYMFWKKAQDPSKKYCDYVIGIAFALSFLLRANNIGAQISTVLIQAILLIKGKHFKELSRVLLRVGTGAAGVLLVTALYFSHLGTLDDLINASLVYNFFYSHGGKQINLIGSLISGFKNIGIVAWIAVIGYICAITRFIKERNSKLTDIFLLLLLLGWPIEILLSSISGYGYDHYFIPWLPMVAFLSGLAFFDIIPWVFHNRVVEIFRKCAFPVLFVFLGMVVFSFKEEIIGYKDTFNTLLFNRKHGIEMVSPVSTYIRGHTSAADKVLVWGGDAGINFMARRDSPTAFVWYPLFADSPLTQRLIDGYYNDITAKKPLYIIDACVESRIDFLCINPNIRNTQIKNQTVIFPQPANVNEVFRFFETNYDLETRIGNYDIYKLKSSN